MLPKYDVCTKQPHGSVGIDWGNPISKGLVVAIDPGNNIDYVSSARGVITGSSYFVRRANGIGLASPTTQVPGSSSFSVNLPPSFNCTCLIVHRGLAAIPIIGYVAAIAMNSTEPVIWNLTGTEARFSTTNNASPAITTLSAGTLYSLVGVKRINSQEQYVNGEKVTTSVTGNREIGSITEIVIGRPEGLANIQNNEEFLLLYFQRALSPEEIKSISANPWQLFHKRNNNLQNITIKEDRKPIIKESTLIGTSKRKLSDVNILNSIVKIARQPQGYVKIDYSNPLSKGLLYLGFSGIGDINYVTNERGIVTNSETLPSTDGRCWSNSDRTTRYSVFKIPNTAVPANRISLGAVATPFSLYEAVICSVHTLNTSARCQIQMSNTTSWGIFTNAGSCASSEKAILGKRTVVSATIGMGETNGTRVYDNGQLVAVNSATAGTATYDTVTIGARFNGGYGLFWHGTTPLQVVWGRALSQAEHESFARNPWQLFHQSSNIPLLK